MTILKTGKFQDQAIDYDAILVVSFGGPEGLDEVIPFLDHVLRGRRIPHERKLAVAKHYEYFNGVSPINAQNRALIAAMEEDFKQNGLALPIYWGNRNWHPFLTDTLRQMRDDGVKRALALFTFAHACYSSCRQYREDIAEACAAVGGEAPVVDRVRFFYNHPGFVEPNVENLKIALKQFSPLPPNDIPIAFVAHSLPVAMANNSAYVAQLTETCNLIAESVQHTNWKLVYQSRSGAPHQPWLEPDICGHLEVLHTKEVKNVVIMPIGFISDHMEVVYDLDVEAAQKANELGINMVRVATVGTNPIFIKMIRELIVERMTENPERRALGSHGPHHDICGETCCLP